MNPTPAEQACLPPEPDGQGMDKLLSRHQAELRVRFPLPDLERLARDAAERKRQRERRRAGGGLLALAALSASLWYWNPAWRHERLSSPLNAQAQVTLRDGTLATLDRDTRLSVAWRLRSRDLTLEQGRAYFDVSHSAWRPFHVQAGRVQVRVLGTRFAVEQAASAVAVTVEEGRVHVRHQAHPGIQDQELDANERLILSDTGQASRETVQADRLLAWQRGQLIINDLPLSQALAQLQPYLPQPLRLGDPALARQRVSAVFQLASLAQLPALLPHVWPVSVQKQDDGGLLLLPAKK
ncbi:MAG: FecR family protein [Alcaligenes sp.]